MLCLVTTVLMLIELLLLLIATAFMRAVLLLLVLNLLQMMRIVRQALNFDSIADQIVDVQPSQEEVCNVHHCCWLSVCRVLYHRSSSSTFSLQGYEMDRPEETGPRQPAADILSNSRSKLLADSIAKTATDVPNFG